MINQKKVEPHKRNDIPEHWLKPIAVRLDEEYLKEVEAIADSESQEKGYKVTKSAIGKMLIEMGLESYKQKGSMAKELSRLRKNMKAIRDLTEF